jgi:hypothetical protein
MMLFTLYIKAVGSLVITSPGPFLGTLLPDLDLTTPL